MRIAAEPHAQPTERRPVTPRPVPSAGVAQVLALQRSAGNQAVARRLARTPVDEAPAATAVNTWPFAAPPDVVKAYVDEHVTEVAVNLPLARVYVVLDTGEEVSLPLASFHDAELDLVPFLPPEASFDAAAAAVPGEWQQAMTAQGMTVCVFYHGSGSVIWPSIMNAQTLPRLMPAYRAALEAAREDAGETADTLVDVALWYVGARIAGIRSRRPPQSKPTPALPAPVAFDVAKVADELTSATSSMPHAGARMIEAGKRLSAMTGPTAQQKVDAMLEFFKRINFIIHQRGVVSEGGYLVMHSEEGAYAFRFALDSGKIIYGRCDVMTGVWTWIPL
jgi:hypothetical protein